MYKFDKLDVADLRILFFVLPKMTMHGIDVPMTHYRVWPMLGPLEDKIYNLCTFCSYILEILIMLLVSMSE